MGRPFRYRKVTGKVRAEYFKPVGVPLNTLAGVELGIDEFEAIRLADYENLYQADAADKMGVSRQTFGNIIKSARGKIADALINGKMISIERGVASGKDTYICEDCGRVWEVSSLDELPQECMACSGDRIMQRLGTRCMNPIKAAKGSGLGPCGRGDKCGPGRKNRPGRGCKLDNNQ
jgi:predicted DNA-binding protein (UPF0251 family)